MYPLVTKHYNGTSIKKQHLEDFEPLKTPIEFEDLAMLTLESLQDLHFTLSSCHLACHFHGYLHFWSS